MNYRLFLKKYFPPPEYLKMNGIGIDITDRSVRYLAFKSRGSEKKLDFYGTVSLPQGALSGGYINKPKVVSAVLRGIFDKVGKKNRFVRVSLPEEKAYIYQTRVSKSAEKNLKEAVSYTLAENVPIKPAEAIFDFTVVPSSYQESDYFDVVVAVIPQKVSEIYNSVVSEAGFLPLVFEIGSQAVARSVVEPNDNKTRLIINLNKNKTGFSIVSRGLVRFTSTIQFGVIDIDKNLAEFLNVDINHIEKIKKEINFDKSQNGELFSILIKTMRPVTDEIKKLKAYWKTHGAVKTGLSKEIVEIILVGKETAITNIPEYLEIVGGIKTTSANVWRNVFDLNKTVPDLDFYESLNYAGAIGLAIGENIV